MKQYFGQSNMRRWRKAQARTYRVSVGTGNALENASSDHGSVHHTQLAVAACHSVHRLVERSHCGSNLSGVRWVHACCPSPSRCLSGAASTQMSATVM